LVISAAQGNSTTSYRGLQLLTPALRVIFGRAEQVLLFVECITLAVNGIISQLRTGCLERVWAALIEHCDELGASNRSGRPPTAR
jgi:hypothetical protein